MYGGFVISFVYRNKYTFNRRNGNTVLSAVYNFAVDLHYTSGYNEKVKITIWFKIAFFSEIKMSALGFEVHVDKENATYVPGIHKGGPVKAFGGLSMAYFFKFNN